MSAHKAQSNISKHDSDIQQQNQLVKLCPEYAPDLREDGMIIVQILKGLYSLIESGYTWYQHLTSFLLSIGSVVCISDQCLFKMGEITLVIYVDDILLTGPENEINNVMDAIEKQFRDCKRKPGPSFKFIGMDSNIKNGGVSVKIDLQTLLENTSGSAETPCANNVLRVKEDVEKLTEENKENVHSLISKLLYIAKRSRPEILFVVNFLCT